MLSVQASAILRRESSIPCTTADLEHRVLQPHRQHDGRHRNGLLAEIMREPGGGEQQHLC